MTILDAATFVKGLAHQRFNQKSLEKYLSEFFNQPIELTDISNQQNKSGFDYNLIFEVPNLQLYVEVYYLKMRKKGWDGEDIFITEIIYGFDKKIW